MNGSTVATQLPDISLTSMIGGIVLDLIERSQAYNTVILLYEDDFSDQILAAWAETDRLSLKTRKIGQLPNGIEVHSFGLDEFPPGTCLELNIRESGRQSENMDGRRTAYKSLLNEVSLISVRFR